MSRKKGTKFGGLFIKSLGRKPSGFHKRPKKFIGKQRKPIAGKRHFKGSVKGSHRRGHA